MAGLYYGIFIPGEYASHIVSILLSDSRYEKLATTDKLKISLTKIRVKMSTPVTFSPEESEIGSEINSESGSEEFDDIKFVKLGKNALPGISENEDLSIVNGTLDASNEVPDASDNTSDASSEWLFSIIAEKMTILGEAPYFDIVPQKLIRVEETHNAAVEFLTSLFELLLAEIPAECVENDVEEPPMYMGWRALYGESELA